jgi:hypothetical protein
MHFVNHVTERHRVRRLIEKLWPSDEYLAHEGLTHRDHLRYLAGKSVALRRPSEPS